MQCLRDYGNEVSIPLLELLLYIFLDALDHMLALIYNAYSMMALILESVPTFEDTWIECLGDFTRYQMAVEKADLSDRKVCAGVARYWYNKAADKRPKVSKIQHYLGLLIRPNSSAILLLYQISSVYATLS